MSNVPLWLRRYSSSVYSKLSKSQYERVKTARMKRFYGQFIKSGNLCFDIGANVGRYSTIFLDLNAHVIAVEPVLENYTLLNERLGHRENLTTLQVAASHIVGPTEIFKGNFLELSSMDNSFIKFNEAQFNCTWTERQFVQGVTLDYLIGQYGIPQFCKIDVEGFESNVLTGLSQVIPVISFEFLLPFRDKALICIEQINTLSPKAVFNYSLFEFFTLEKSRWMDASTFISHFKKLPEGFKTGDIICRLY